MAITRPTTHMSGGKLSGTHQTVIPAAVPIVQAAQKMPAIKRISLSIIKPLQNGDPSVKFIEDNPGCLLGKIRGRTAIQEIRFYLQDSTADKTALGTELGKHLRV